MLLLRLIIIATSAFLVLEMPGPAEARGGVFLRVRDEWSNRSETVPSRALTEFFVRRFSDSDKYDLKYCSIENNINKYDEQRFFRIIQLATISNSKLYMFRPSQKPYCDMMYGSSGFRYILFRQTKIGKSMRYKVIFNGQSHTFEAFKTKHNGLPDFKIYTKDGYGYGTINYQFDGKRYRYIRCARILEDEAEHRYPCDSEVPLALR